MARRRDWRDPRRVLAANGFHDIEAPSGVISRRKPTDKQLARANHLERALAFLEEHRFRSKFDRKIWQLHCDGLSNRAIKRRLHTYRKLVDTRVRQLTAIMDGRPIRRPGRPEKPDGLGEASSIARVRFGGPSLAALHFLMDALHVGLCDAVRLAVRAQASQVSGNSVDGKSGARS